MAHSAIAMKAKLSLAEFPSWQRLPHEPCPLSSSERHPFQTQDSVAIPHGHTSLCVTRRCCILLPGTGEVEEPAQQWELLQG